MTSTHREKASPTIILIAGHWLGAWAWNQVTEQLKSTNVSSIALTLPGLNAQELDRSSRTLEDQVSAIQTAIKETPGEVILVAHSGANVPVSVVIDQNPEAVKRIIWVDSGPVAAGTSIAPNFPDSIEELSLPPFDQLEAQASLAGLSTEQLLQFREKAVPEPGKVLRATAQLTNETRFRVPTSLICCSISTAQILELIEAGHPMFAEVSNYSDVEYLDLPTGHWPMWSRPNDLALLISNAATKR